MARKRATVTTARLRKAATSRQSALFRWMLEHHDEFARVLADAGRPNWTALAKEFGDGGLTDSDGKPPTPEGARQTWWKARKVLTARPALRSPAPPPSPAPRPLTAHLRPAQPTTTKPPTPEGQNARSAPAGRFRHDPVAREGEFENLLGPSNKPSSK